MLDCVDDCNCVSGAVQCHQPRYTRYRELWRQRYLHDRLGHPWKPLYRGARPFGGSGFALKSCSAADRASGDTFTIPANGRSMTTMTRSPEKIKAVSAPVIRVWARRLSVAKKNVKATVTMAPPNKTNHTMPGTMPVATTSRALRAWVTASS